MKFTELYQDNFVCMEPFDNGEFLSYFFIRMVDMWDACGECPDNKRFIGEIVAVAPSEVSKKKTEETIGSTDFDQWGDRDNPIHIAQMLFDYGIYANLACIKSSFNFDPETEYDDDSTYDESSDYDDVYERALKEAGMIEMLFGFYMDKQQNRIGATGWDVIKGNLDPFNVMGIDREDDDEL